MVHCFETGFGMNFSFLLVFSFGNGRVACFFVCRASDSPCPAIYAFILLSEAPACVHASDSACPANPVHFHCLQSLVRHRLPPANDDAPVSTDRFAVVKLAGSQYKVCKVCAIIVQTHSCLRYLAQPPRSCTIESTLAHVDIQLVLFLRASDGCCHSASGAN